MIPPNLEIKPYLLPLKIKENIRHLHKKRHSIYLILLIICFIYISYSFFVDKTDIYNKTKYYNRSDFILKLDDEHKLALKEFIVETINENNDHKCRKNILKDKILNVLPVIGLSAFLRFDSYHDTSDALITGFISIVLVTMIHDILHI